MSFCSDEINFSEIFDLVYSVYEKASKITDVEPLQAIGLVREIMQDIEDFKLKLEEISFKTLICMILDNIDVEDYTNEVEVFVNQIFDELDILDEKVSNLSGDFETIRNDVDILVNIFFDIKTNLERYIDDKLKELFAPLIELGANEEDIENALEDVVLSDSPSQYIIDVFNQIVTNTLLRLD